MTPTCLPGLDALRDDTPPWLKGRRVGLLTHPAAVDSRGVHATDILHRADCTLVRLFGPEHGYFGWGGAGEKIMDGTHPLLGLPVYSLYGEHRQPPSELLADLDVLVVDLQDLAVRCYTYVSTLHLVMETAAACGCELAVLDRPIPLPDTLDGPGLEDGHQSFVAQVDAPMVYGMTPGETALWLRERYNLSLPIHIQPITGYARRPAHVQVQAPWIPPSPAIRSWWCAYAYPVTVFAEAFPGLDVDRFGTLPFQRIAAKGVDGCQTAGRFNAHQPAGIRAVPDWLRSQSGEVLEGVRLILTDPAAIRPLEAMLFLIDAIHKSGGIPHLWASPEARPAFFDQLMGGPSVRSHLQSGASPRDIAAAWSQNLKRFEIERAGHLLYPQQA